MDTLSHGLWGSIVFGRRNKRDFWWSFFFGVSPDIFSFGVFTFANLFLFEERTFGRPELADIPTYVHTLYNITHSFVVWAIVFALVWAIMRKPFLPMFAWPLHIILDIFTHSTDFFPTPFLWPVTEYRFDGVSWGAPAIFFTNLFLLALSYAIWAIRWYIRKKRLANTRFGA